MHFKKSNRPGCIQGSRFRHWVTKRSNIYAACSNARWSSGISAPQKRPRIPPSWCERLFLGASIYPRRRRGSVCFAAGGVRHDRRSSFHRWRRWGISTWRWAACPNRAHTTPSPSATWLWTCWRLQDRWKWTVNLFRCVWINIPVTVIFYMRQDFLLVHVWLFSRNMVLQRGWD